MTEERVARALRVREAAARGIRAVPAEPGPEFLAVPFACDLYPSPCYACKLDPCLRTEERSA